MLSEALLSQQWNVIGFSAMSCVYTVTGFLVFFVVFETAREEIVYLSGVSVSHVAHPKSCVSSESVLKYQGLDCCLSLYVVNFALLSPAREFHAIACIHQHGNDASIDASIDGKDDYLDERLIFTSNDESLHLNDGVRAIARFPPSEATQEGWHWT
jgi:hypothetical protein